MGTFRVFFSGLCAYLPDVDLGDPDPNRNPSKMLVLMPNVMDVESRGALDGRKLRSHYPILDFKADNLVDRGGIPSNADLRWSVARKEISFILKESVPGSNPFAVVQRLRDKNPRPGNYKEDFSYGAHIREIWKDSVNFKLRPECFLDSGSIDVLAARCRLTQGRLSAWGLNERLNFTFTGSLGGDFLARPLSNISALEFYATTKVTLVIRSLDDPADIALLEFNTDVGYDVEIFLGNICCDLNPLDDAAASPLGLPARIRRDKDFRSYFDLFDSNGMQSIVKTLAGVALPIPLPNNVAGGAGLRVVQCMSLSLNAQSF